MYIQNRVHRSGYILLPVRYVMYALPQLRPSIYRPTVLLMLSALRVHLNVTIKINHKMDSNPWCSQNELRIKYKVLMVTVYLNDIHFIPTQFFMIDIYLHLFIGKCLIWLININVGIINIYECISHIDEVNGVSVYKRTK